MCAMDSVIKLHRKSTGDLVNLRVDVPSGTLLVTSTYLEHRFDLDSMAGISQIRRITDDGDEVVEVDISGNGMEWRLSGGNSYHILSKLDPIAPLADEIEVTNLSSSSDGDEDIVIPVTPGEIELPLPTSGPRISALDCLLTIRGSSELARFVRSFSFQVEHVSHLPSSYNGDIVFELPPIDRQSGKRACLLDMDRAQDCYLWTRMISTSANLRPKKVFKISKVSCSGALECKNHLCEHVRTHGKGNERSWIGRSN